MALTADFSATSRVGMEPLIVTFTDSSTGTITSRKWIMGDGTTYEGNDTSIVHTYAIHGKYDVILVVQDGTDQDTEIKEDYVIVNELYIDPNFVIAQSMTVVDEEYWKFYFDIDRHLVFESQDFVYRSADPVLVMKKWTLVEFHSGGDKMYVGTYNTIRREVPMSVSVNNSPIGVNAVMFQIAPQSTIKVDELKIWYKEVNLRDYYYETRGQAGNLDATT